MRSESLAAAAVVVVGLADVLRGEAAVVAGALAVTGHPLRWGGPGVALDGGVWVAWARLEGRVLSLAGPGGLLGEAFALDAVALDLRAAARVYAEVERSVAAVLAGVARGADLAARGGWLTDGSSRPVAHLVAPTLTGPLVGGPWPGAPGGSLGRAEGAADLVAAGAALGGGRVRVLETLAPDGGAAWVVVVPGTQEWSPRAGANPFDLTSDVRAVTGDATVAAAGVAAAVDLARSSSPRSRPDDPVLLVGQSQGGILAAALASDATFTARHRVTHVVTAGSPVGVFPVPGSVRVLSVEHADDPVPRLDLTPNPARSSWLTVVAPPAELPVDPRRHALDAYVDTLRTAEDAPRGTVPGLDAWQASAGAFVGAPVRSVTEVVVERSLAGREEAAGGPG
ncbi:hypothetical protein [Oryzobacter telluris]|uniref:hypothetical protein n=1 Tax=Oryzobacter telluris TaxID=3149179 RepID=UPI00370D0A97